MWPYIVPRMLGLGPLRSEVGLGDNLASGALVWVSGSGHRVSGGGKGTSWKGGSGCRELWGEMEAKREVLIGEQPQIRQDRGKRN